MLEVVQQAAILVIDPLPVVRRTHNLEAIGIGLDQCVGIGVPERAVPDGAVVVDVVVLDDGLIE